MGALHVEGLQGEAPGSPGGRGSGGGGVNVDTILYGGFPGKKQALLCRQVGIG